MWIQKDEELWIIMREGIICELKSSNDQDEISGKRQNEFYPSESNSGLPGTLAKIYMGLEYMETFFHQFVWSHT